MSQTANFRRNSLCATIFSLYLSQLLMLTVLLFLKKSVARLHYRHCSFVGANDYGLPRQKTCFSVVAIVVDTNVWLRAIRRWTKRHQNSSRIHMFNVNGFPGGIHKMQTLHNISPERLRLRAQHTHAQLHNILKFPHRQLTYYNFVWPSSFMANCGDYSFILFYFERAELIDSNIQPKNLPKMTTISLFTTNTTISVNHIFYTDFIKFSHSASIRPFRWELP